jgi:hypothetical protein
LLPPPLSAVPAGAGAGRASRTSRSSRGCRCRVETAVQAAPVEVAVAEIAHLLLDQFVPFAVVLQIQLAADLDPLGKFFGICHIKNARLNLPFVFHVIPDRDELKS